MHIDRCNDRQIKHRLFENFSVSNNDEEIRFHVRMIRDEGRQKCVDVLRLQQLDLVIERERLHRRMRELLLSADGFIRLRDHRFYIKKIIMQKCAQRRDSEVGRAAEEDGVRHVYRECNAMCHGEHRRTMMHIVAFNLTFDRHTQGEEFLQQEMIVAASLQT